MLVTEATQKFESKSQLFGMVLLTLIDVGNRSYPKIWKQITTPTPLHNSSFLMLVTEATQKFESKSQQATWQGQESTRCW